MMRYGTALIAMLLVPLGLGCYKGPITGQRYLIPTQQYDEEVRRHYVQEHPDLPEEIEQAVLEGRIVRGMSPEAVDAVLGLDPWMITTDEHLPDGKHVEVYNTGQYRLDFLDGELISWGRVPPRRYYYHDPWDHGYYRGFHHPYGYHGAHGLHDHPPLRVAP